MKKYDAIGLMSGTSLDGLDIAYVRFIYDSEWKFEVIQCESIAYEKDLYTRLHEANHLSALDLKKLDLRYGQWIGKKVKDFIDSNHILADLIVSHGHTVFHQPEIGLTHQIGDGYQILKETKTKTISDLRSLDVALGGQGAPLVPVGDQLLFSNFDLCLNLGGFSNISFDKAGSRIAYDICPVNTVVNKLTSNMGLEYDKGGNIAKSGNTNLKLLHKLNALEYYTQTPPKSLGIEWVYEHIFPILNNDSTENLINTFCHHVAHQIYSSIESSNISANKSNIPKMLVTGGGAKNHFLIELLKIQANEKVDIIIPDVQIVDFKEAIIFAFLGLLRTLGETNTLKSVTGATANSSGGLIFDQIHY